MSTNLQRPPRSDNRYRVHRSVKCYVAELVCGGQGCTWYLSDSIERVVYRFPKGIEKVQYRTRFYELQPSDRMKDLIAEQLRIGGAIHLSGKYLSAFEPDRQFDPYPFIDVSSHEDKAKFEGFLQRGKGKRLQDEA